MHNNKPRHRSVARAVAVLGAATLLTAVPARAQVDEIGPQPEALAPTVLIDAQRQYRQAMDAELYTEAADAAKRYIAELLEDDDFDRTEWALALNQLADAQYLGGDYRAAVQNFRDAVEVLEAQTNQLNLDIVEPLTGLGHAYYAVGNLRDAVQAFERAAHVYQVNSGLHALEQGEILDSMAEVYFDMGDYNRANALEQSYVSIVEKNYPGADVRKLPALFSQAQMLRRTDRLYDASGAYNRMIAMIEKAEGRASLHLLPALYEVADLQRHHGHEMIDMIDGKKKARRLLRRAVYIAEKNEDATPEIIADAHLRLGAFLATETANRRAALRSFRRAWDVLSTDESLLAARDERFAEPALLNVVPNGTAPSMRKLLMMSLNATDYSDGRLVVRYDVDTQGSTQNVQLVEPDPTGYWDEIIVAHVNKLVFRPRFEDGQPVEQQGQLFELRYSSADADSVTDFGQNTLLRHTADVSDD